MSDPTAPQDPVDPAPRAEPRQRWRLVVARAADAAPADHFGSAIAATALPLARSAGVSARPRISFGAPLPAGMAANGELIDLVLTECWPVWRVRAALTEAMPPGWRLMDLYDVWLAGPPLAGRVAAADYRIVLVGEVPLERLRAAAHALLAAERLPRERAKGSGTVAYDLRPLLLDLGVSAGPPAIVVCRTRLHPELGSGRPEEVILALAAQAGVGLNPIEVIRDRLLLADDVA